MRGTSSKYGVEPALENWEPTEVNRVNSKHLETLRTSFLAILRRAIDLIRLAPFDESELRCKEDFIALTSAAEPFS